MSSNTMSDNNPDATEVASSEPTPTKSSHTTRRIALALAVGLATFLAVQLAQGLGATKAEVIMVLDGNEVSWPYHDAVREAGAGRVTSDPIAVNLARDIAGPDATLDSVLLNGPSHFSFSVTADDSAQAAEAADAIAAWLSDANAADLRQPMEQELALLATNTENLDLELAELAASITEADAVETARYLEKGSLLAEHERRADQVEIDLALVRPQYSAAGPAEVPDRFLTPLITALGAALAALAAFFVFEPR